MCVHVRDIVYVYNVRGNSIVNLQKSFSTLLRAQHSVLWCWFIGGDTQAQHKHAHLCTDGKGLPIN